MPAGVGSRTLGAITLSIFFSSTSLSANLTSGSLLTLLQMAAALAVNTSAPLLPTNVPKSTTAVSAPVPLLCFGRSSCRKPGLAGAGRFHSHDVFTNHEYHVNNLAAARIVLVIGNYILYGRFVQFPVINLVKILAVNINGAE